MSAIDDFVKNSVVGYLQSVVFVDDKIYSIDGRPLPNQTDPIFLGGGFPAQFSQDEPLPSEECGNVNRVAQLDSSKELNSDFAAPNATQVNSTPFHARDLMESFARKGIACALYEPREQFATDSTSELFRLCERADIVILDWDLHKDDGAGVSQLLMELVKKGQSELPHHVRLCAIYTDKPSLHRVLDQLRQKLEHGACPITIEEGKLRFIAGATRISIFGKPNSIGRTAEDKPYEVNESDLADKVIDEFSKLHHGLLPAFALHGLAAVRKNTKRLLDKFSHELDGAFLLHRTLVLNNSDAFDDLPDLLSDEIRAILEDSWPTSHSLENITAATADSIPLNRPSRSWNKKNGEVTCDEVTAFRTMLKGIEGIKGAGELYTNIKIGPDVKADLLRDFDDMLRSTGASRIEHLAALFCNKTQYGAVKRNLHFGTVIRHKNDPAEAWSFSLCLMPICDSQRLEAKTAFPFWRLNADAKLLKKGKRNGIVIVDAEGITHCLAAGGKIRDMLWVASFTPNFNKTVCAVAADGIMSFPNDNNMIVEWVAQLKPLHAQRIAAYMGAEVSRVGLVESEWLRLHCDR